MHTTNIIVNWYHNTSYSSLVKHCWVNKFKPDDIAVSMATSLIQLDLLNLSNRRWTGYNEGQIEDEQAIMKVKGMHVENVTVLRGDSMLPTWYCSLTFSGIIDRNIFNFNIIFIVIIIKIFMQEYSIYFILCKIDCIFWTDHCLNLYNFSFNNYI